MTIVFQAQQEETREKISFLTHIYIYTREVFFCMYGKGCVRRGIRCVEKATTTTTTLFTKSEIIYLFIWLCFIDFDKFCVFVCISTL